MMNANQLSCVLAKLLVEALKRVPENKVTTTFDINDKGLDRDQSIRLRELLIQLDFKQEAALGGPFGAAYSVRLEAGYTLVERQGYKGIKCNTCNLTSFHPKDIESHYCANCNVFHDVIGQQKQIEEAVKQRRKVEAGE